MKSKVFVLAQEVGKCIAFHVVCPTRGLSPLYCIEGNKYIDGNPYGIYGDQVAEWTHKDKYSLSIVVLQPTSSAIVNEHEVEEFLSKFNPKL